MENQDNFSQLNITNELPQLTSISVKYILKAAKWGKFMAILGFIVTGLIIVAAVAMSFILDSFHDEMVPLDIPFSPTFFAVLYIIFAILYLIPVIFLNSFCNQAIKAVQQSSTEYLSLSLRNLKNLFVYIGISTIVILSLYTLIIIVAGITAFISL